MMGFQVPAVQPRSREITQTTLPRETSRDRDRHLATEAGRGEPPCCYPPGGVQTQQK